MGGAMCACNDAPTVKAIVIFRVQVAEAEFSAGE